MSLDNHGRVEYQNGNFFGKMQLNLETMKVKIFNFLPKTAIAYCKNLITNISIFSDHKITSFLENLFEKLFNKALFLQFSRFFRSKNVSHTLKLYLISLKIFYRSK